MAQSQVESQIIHWTPSLHSLPAMLRKWTHNPSAVWKYIRTESTTLAFNITKIEPGVVIKVLTVEYMLEETACQEFARRRLPTVPIPRVLSMQTSLHPTYFAMEEVYGEPLEKSLPHMSSSELDHVAAQLSAILGHLRSLVGNGGVGGVTGRPLRSSLFQEMPPHQYFPNVQGFYDHVIDSFTEQTRAVGDNDDTWGKAIMAKFPQHPSVHFTHGDMVPPNIMVRGSTIVGLIDWGMAGWYPDYWEFCRCRAWVRSGEAGEKWGQIVHHIFPASEYNESASRAYENLLHNMSSGGLLF
jgi:aminoglycoside phosphotransferase